MCVYFLFGNFTSAAHSTQTKQDISPMRREELIVTDLDGKEDATTVQGVTDARLKLLAMWLEDAGRRYVFHTCSFK